MAAKKKEVKKETPSAKKDYYQTKGDKLERIKKNCPKCGSHMVHKPRKNTPLLLCTNETCRYHEVDEEAAERDNEQE